ncbi:MAG: Holliday junction resolvase RuvX [Cytophagales bacterium]|nr:Holliday junction resolvase RuvX [Bernardetiaceae bacterium]MDW8205122.1 Holliday junction resolvase RuvX [Cytophagales bacterium]
MGRILAIDYGSKRTGIAVSDPLQLIASPLETVATAQLMDFLTNYLSTEQVDEIIVGLPKKLDNTETSTTPLVKGFVKSLRKKYPHIPVYEMDERLTSIIAMQSMIAAGSKKKDRKEKAGNLDKVSAALILQSYMEQKKNTAL